MRNKNTTSRDAAGGQNERDSKLFAQFVAGDQEAFKQLYRFYERPLILYCQHLLPTEQEAQDVFQETWLRVVRVRRRGEEVKHFRALLFTIARNIALNHLNALKQSASNLSLASLEAQNERLAAESSGFDEIEGLVDRALKRLPVIQREAFVLHAVLGYTFEEIAEMQGGSMSAAKTRAFRARSYLRKLLSNWLGLAEDDPIDEDDELRSLHSPYLFTRER